MHSQWLSRQKVFELVWGVKNEAAWAAHIRVCRPQAGQDLFLRCVAHGTNRLKKHEAGYDRFDVTPLQRVPKIVPEKHLLVQFLMNPDQFYAFVGNHQKLPVLFLYSIFGAGLPVGSFADS